MVEEEEVVEEAVDAMDSVRVGIFSVIFVVEYGYYVVVVVGTVAAPGGYLSAGKKK